MFSVAKILLDYISDWLDHFVPHQQYMTFCYFTPWFVIGASNYHFSHSKRFILIWFFDTDNIDHLFVCLFRKNLFLLLTQNLILPGWLGTSYVAENDLESLVTLPIPLKCYGVQSHATNPIVFSVKDGTLSFMGARYSAEWVNPQLPEDLVHRVPIALPDMSSCSCAGSLSVLSLKL